MDPRPRNIFIAILLALALASIPPIHGARDLMTRRVNIHDASGRLVRTVAVGSYPAGYTP